jgi:HlyD family secretion protein
VSQALANVELARAALAKAVVVAPFSGVVLTVDVEAGETTAPGAPLLQLADVSELHVDGEIDEADLGRVKVGMPVDVSLDAFPGERVRGALEEIAPSVTRDLRGGRSIAITVRLPHDERLRVGMSADLDVIVEVREGTLFVPPNAILGRGAERSAYVVQGGVAHKRAVDVGVSTWEAVEIRSGLSEGDEVVASLSTVELADGARVQLKPRGK